MWNAISFVHDLCPEYDTKQLDGETPVMKLWGMLSASSLLLLPDPLNSEVIIPSRVWSIGQTEKNVLSFSLLETI